MENSIEKICFEIKDILMETIKFDINALEGLGFTDGLAKVGMNSVTFVQFNVSIEESYDIEFELGEISYKKQNILKEIAKLIQKKKIEDG